MNRARCLMTLLCFLMGLTAHGATEISVKSYTTDDGLPSNYVINMVQDPKGFVWISTHNGLCRFDGYTFHHYSHDKTGPARLPHSNIVRHIDMNPNGLLWIRFYGDVYSCYDVNRERFVSYTADGVDPRGLRECTFMSNGDTWLWMKGKGALRVTYSDLTPSSCFFSTLEGNLDNDHINFMKEDARGRVWIGTDQGLFLVDGDKTKAFFADRQMVGATLVADRLYVVDRHGNVLCVTDDGVVEEVSGGQQLTGITDVVTLGHRLLILTTADSWEYDPDSRQTSRSATIQAPNGYTVLPMKNAVVDLTGQLHYIIDDGRVIHLQVFPHTILRETYGKVKVNRDAHDRLWISTQGNGLFIYDMQTATMQHYNTSSQYTPLGSDNIFNQIVDDSGNVWLAFDNMGICRVTPIAASVSRSHDSTDTKAGRESEVICLSRQTDATLLAANHLHQVLRVDTATLAMQPLLTVGDDNVRSILTTDDGTLWLGTDYSGLRIGDRWYCHDHSDSLSLGHNHVLDLLQDRHGHVWVACASGGLCLAEPAATGYRFRRFFGPATLHRKVISIHECADGRLIAGTDRGIIVFRSDELLDDSTRYQTFFDTSEDNWFDVHAIAELADGRIAYVTTGAGLYVGDIASTDDAFPFRRYTTADGLPDLTCTSMVTDDDGLLWIGTQWGLACMDPATGTFNRYYLTPDHTGNVFANGSAVRLADGQLVFGTSNGLLAFHPFSIHYPPSTIHQSPRLTGIRVGGVPLQDLVDVDATQPLRLAYNQNSLTFYVSCFDYGNEQTTEYAFLLKGLDNDWSLPSSQNFVTYSNLSPGTYTLLVRSRNIQYGSEFSETAFSFTIRPPFWATWWARLVYVLLAGLLIWQIVHGLLTQYRLRRSLELERRMTEFKSEFFMNISHELRTPLMLIQGSIERLRSMQLVSGDMKQPVKNMQLSASRLLRLTSQLLTFNKLQSDRLHLRLQTTDVVRLSRDIVQTFNDTAATRQIALSFTPQMASLEIPLDRDMFDKMLYNLLSNALKYTPDRGSIHVSLRHHSSILHLSVADTGIGIKPDQKKVLFERFARSTVAVDSIGIGLNLAYQLARVHHGELIHEDNPGGGSIFTITLPADETPYTADDWATELDNPAQTDAPDAEEEFVEMLPLPLNDRRVVLAEDDPDVRDYLTRELGRYFDVVATADGEAAFAEVKRCKPDLIVSDVVMPRMDGIELLKRVRHDDDTFDIPFVLLTAMDDARRRMQGVQSGADSYLPKPVSISLLTTRCLKLLEQYERLKQQFSREALTPKQPPVIATDQDKKFRDILDAKIEARLSDPHLNVDELGESMNYRHSQFFSRVKEVTGMPPGEYIKRIKMERAVKMLEDETVTISEVAYKLGFNDPLYFGRCFKQHYGNTPSQYRKGQKNVK